MDYIVLFNENNVTLQISGRLDSTTSPLLEEKINSELEGKAIKKVTIDAIKLDYISSAGLRVVL
ncbi:MAG: STAS domain-containing protein, partial [Bacilli bacterium]|nr:STAS domain-containing protein [Bacilli bacterium]